MNVREFVSESITEIMQGIVDAQENVSKIGGTVNPRKTLRSFAGAQGPGYQPKTKPKQVDLIHTIDFDIAVTVSEESGKSGKAGLSVMNIGAGGEASVSAGQSSVSRIKFQIPVVCPHPPK